MASYFCAAFPQPPVRVADGEWRCDDDRYELAGAKFSWPGGRAHIEPAECAPRELPASYLAAGAPQSGPPSLSLANSAPPDL